MKNTQIALIAITFLVSLSSHAQDVDISFIKKQALKDALYEQVVTFETEEDANDFWADQLKYEIDLLNKSEKAHTAYINTKKKIYLEHLKICTKACDHNSYYLLQLGIYASGDTEDQMVVERDPKKTKRKSE